jgi:hypothetical protein
MILTTRGKPTKMPLKLCREAVRFYANYLLQKRTFQNIHVELCFSNNDLASSDHGAAEWVDTNIRGREFLLTVRPSLGKRLMLLTLAHESIHIKQYATGELIDYLNQPNHNKCKWKGKVYNDARSFLQYWELPWEIEAHGREKALYYNFLTYYALKYGK